mgnify:CR=1 FL=1
MRPVTDPIVPDEPDEPDDIDTDDGIVPDDKDWTWVLERPCPACGFEAAAIDVTDVPAMIRANAEEWRVILAAPDDEVRSRPAFDRWSPLEYGAHVRDVHRIYLERLERMLTEDGPHYANWDQDATAVAERYRAADPTTVAAELTEAAEALAARFATVVGDQWERTGFRSDGARFTVDSFARYYIHDPVHHVHDVRTGRAG